MHFATFVMAQLHFFAFGYSIVKKRKSKRHFRETVLYSERIKEKDEQMVDNTPLGSLLPSRANAREAQTLEDFQRDYIRLGFCVNR